MAGYLESADDLHRADFVADPAANPTGLSMFSGTPSELAEKATLALDEICEAHGRDRVLSFLEGYFAQSFLGELQAENAALKSKVAKAIAQVEDLRRIEADRRRELEAEYVSGLQRACAEAQQPLAADEREQVEKLFSQGLSDAARAVGEAIRSRALAAQGAFERVREFELERASGAQDEPPAKTIDRLYGHVVKRG